MREVDVSSLDPMPDAPEGTLGVLGLATAGQEIDAVVRFCKAAIARYRDAGAAQEAPVAVLFRSKSHMPEYQEVLRRPVSPRLWSDIPLCWSAQKSAMCWHCCTSLPTIPIPER